MSLLHDERIGAQDPVIHHLPGGVHSLDAATECIELADAYGICDGNPLAESQKITLRGALGERADGTWAASTVADFGPRQGTGKNDKIAARELAGLILFGERLIIHTAHEFPTANESFLRLVEVFENHDDLRKKVARIRYANGEQGIELLSGQRLKYKARTGGGGRGFAKADLIIYDEAQHLQVEHVAASGPSKMANPNSQTWYAGSGGLSTSRQAWALRMKALSGNAGRLAYTEMTAEVVGRLESGKPSFTPPIDVLDRDYWYKSIPGLGIWVTEESVYTQYEELGPELFAREILCVWDPLPEDQGDPKVPADLWAALPKGTAPEGGNVLVFDVDLDGESASIGRAAGIVSAPYFELVAHQNGVRWLADDLVRRVKKKMPLCVAYNGAGPALEAVGPITVAFREAGISTDLLLPVNASGARAACAATLSRVREGSLTLAASEQGPLHRAAADATERPLGDGWVWARRQAPVPVSPMWCLSIGCHLLPTESSQGVSVPMFAST